MEEFPAEENNAVSDNRPLVERLEDKNWKARIVAYEDLRKHLDQCDNDELSNYAGLLEKMTADNNAGALDSGLETAILLIEKLPVNSVVQHSEKLSVNIVEKTFNARASTLSKGKVLLLKLMEIDDPVSCCRVLVSKLTDKKPKTPPTCMEVLHEGMIMYGAKPFPIKEIVKALGPVLNGSNSAAREGSLNLMVLIWRYLGIAPLQQLLDSLRTAQKTDFEKLIAEAGTEKPVPTLWLRKDRPVEGISINSVTAEKVAIKNNDQDGDARDFVEEVDLNRKLKSTDYATLIKSDKWSEQLKALQIVIDSIGPVPNLKQGTDVQDLLSECKSFLRQGHLQLQLHSLKVVSLLADGLRSEFATSVRPLTQTIVQKCKEKRLVNDIQDCLTAVLRHCIAFEYIVTDILEQIQAKNPSHAKICLLEFISSTFQNLDEKVSNDSLKSVAETLVNNCEDSDPKVRESVSIALVSTTNLVRKRGKSAVEAYRILSSLEQKAPRIYKKMNAVVESAKSVEVTALKTSIPKVSSSLKELPTTSGDAGKIVAPTRSLRKPLVKAKPTTAPIKKIADDTADDDVDDLAISEEEALDALEPLGIDGLKSTFKDRINSSKWQDKVEALNLLERKIVESNQGGKLSAPLVALLSSTSSGFKISNLNTLKATIQLACATASHAGDSKFSKPAAWELLKQFGDKLADKKTKDLVQTLLTGLSESISPSFVFKRMKFVMEKIKAPLAHQFFLEWLKDSIRDFGGSTFPIPLVCSFCRNEAENKISTVRSASVEVVGQLYHQIGPKLLGLVFPENTSGNTKTLFEAEFAKVGYDPNSSSKSTRVVKGEGQDSQENKNGISRSDLCSLLDKNIIHEINFVDGKNSWQNRKAAMETVIGACERSGHYLDSNKATGEIVKALRGRVNDTQANLKPIAVTAIGHILASLELDSCAKVLRVVAAGILSGLADNKKQMRDATISAIQMICTLNGQDQVKASVVLTAVLVPSIAEALGNTVGRLELLTWMNANADSFKADCNDLVAPLVGTLQDKVTAVRTMSEQFLGTLMGRAIINRQLLDKATRDLPPANKRALQANIDRLNSLYGSRRQIQQSLSTDSHESLHQTSKMPLSNETGTTVKGACEKPISSAQNWLLKRNSKQNRLDNFVGLNWPQPPDYPGAKEFGMLRTEWEPFLTSDLAYLLFSCDQHAFQEAYVPGILELSNQLDCPYLLDHSDFIFRWCVCFLYFEESTNGVNAIVKLIKDLLESFRSCDGKSGLHDREFEIILPHLLECCGRNSRSSNSLKEVIELFADLVPPTKIASYYMKGVYSSSRKVSTICLTYFKSLVEENGPVMVGKDNCKSLIAVLLDDEIDTGTKDSCLEVIRAIYHSLNSSFNDLIQFINLSDRTLIESLREKLEQSVGKKVKEDDEKILKQIDAVIALSPMIKSNDKRNNESMSRTPAEYGIKTDLVFIYKEIQNKISNFLVDPQLHGDNYDTAKDYIKMLHAIVNGDWCREMHENDLLILTENADDLILKLLNCVSVVFELNSERNIGEVSLLAITLSTLFLLIKNTQIVSNLSSETVFQVFYVCLHRISDQALERAGSLDLIEISAQVSRALNMIVLKLSMEASVSVVLQVLLKVLFLCIPSTTVSNVYDCPCLPPIATKPTSRLIIKVLSDEANKAHPYAESPSIIRALLISLHEFFLKYPADAANDVPFRTAKTLLSELIKALGGYQILTLLQETSIDQSAFIYQLTSRLGNVNLSDTDTDLHAKLVQLIEDITSSRDKISAIKELHSLKKRNPGLDINLYLHKISSAFRRFVLDTLAKLDTTDDDVDVDVENTDNINLHSERTNVNVIRKQSLNLNVQDLKDQIEKVRIVSNSINITTDFDKSIHSKHALMQKALANDKAVDSSALESSTNEALRIIEGLKNRPTSIARHRHSRSAENLQSSLFDEMDKNLAGDAFDAGISKRPGLKSSPFSERNDKIRDSLSNLSATLDLLPTPVTVGQEARSSRLSIGRSDPSSFYQNEKDLAARLQRLKN